MPLISIIIPTYNRVDFIIETLHSVEAQIFKNWECIIIDDGSTDNTEDVVRIYIKDKPSFSYFKRPANYKPGANGARNYGFDLAKAPYVCWLDSDDLIFPEKLHKQYQAIVENNADLCVCDWQYYEQGKALPEKNKFAIKEELVTGYALLEKMGSGNKRLITDTYLVTKELVTRSGGWNEYITIYQDIEFISRLSCNTDKIMILPQVLCNYRKDSTNRISNMNFQIPKIADKIRCLQMIKTNLDLRYQLEYPKIFMRKELDEMFNYLIYHKFYELVEKNQHVFFEQISAYGKLKFYIKKSLSI